MSKKGKRARKNRRSQHKVPKNQLRTKSATRGQNGAKSVSKKAEPKAKKSNVVSKYSYGCHSHNPQLVFKSGKLSVYAGARIALLRKVEHCEIIPSIAFNLSQMNADFHAWSPIICNDAANERLPRAVTHPFAFEKTAVIDIDWDDYSVPDGLDREWWQAMTDTVMATEGDVAVCCVGGHGRTGTFLSILIGLSGMLDEGVCPVTAMREMYCADAVESDEQIKYIQEMTGRRVEAKASGADYFLGAYGGGLYGGEERWYGGTPAYGYDERGQYWGRNPANRPASNSGGANTGATRKEEESTTGSAATQRAGITPAVGAQTSQETDPGALDYTICQTGKPPVSASQYLDELDQEALSYSNGTALAEEVEEVVDQLPSDHVNQLIRDAIVRNPDILKGA